MASVRRTPLRRSGGVTSSAPPLGWVSPHHARINSVRTAASASGDDDGADDDNALAVAWAFRDSDSESDSDSEPSAPLNAPSAASENAGRSLTGAARADEAREAAEAAAADLPEAEAVTEAEAEAEAEAEDAAIDAKAARVGDAAVCLAVDSRGR